MKISLNYIMMRMTQHLEQHNDNYFI
jgi:hypothetical protein